MTAIPPQSGIFHRQLRAQFLTKFAATRALAGSAFAAGGPEIGPYRRRPMLGISALVTITGRLALRTSPHYQRIGHDGYSITPAGTSPNLFGTSTVVTLANRWKLPVSAAWRFAKHLNAGIGGTWSSVTGESTVYRSVAPPPHSYTNVFPGTTLSRKNILGATADMEFPFATRIGVVAPSLQYTRWAGRHFGYYWPLNRVVAGVTLRFRLGRNE
ncbi:MAG: hypothetical protein ACK5AZ_23760 [Bryobacteraceae bacterium]